VGTVAGFPHGTGKATLKAIETTSSLKDGADEVFVSAHLANLFTGDFDAARGELLDIARAARATRRDAMLHVVIESAALLSLGEEKSDEAFAVACRAARESGCDGIATASGYHRAGGASLAAVAALRAHADGLTVIAMGGIPNASVAQALLDGGADRAVIDPAP
jgi:deoxyribose-phosphate aldolase